MEGWPYEVSSEGRVRRSTPGRHTVVGLVLKPCLDPDGYQTVTLRRPVGDGFARRTHRVHRLVAAAFHGPHPEGCGQVNHKNGIKTDNHPENLEWVSGAENTKHAVANGLWPDQAGEANPAAVLTEDDVRLIRALRASGIPNWAVAARFGISEGLTSMVARRLRWGHVA